MQIHNKRFIFIRIMVKVNVVADQNLIINLELSVPSVQCYQVFQVDQMSCTAGMMMMAQQYAMRKKTPPPPSPQMGPVEGLQARLGTRRQEIF